MIFRFLILSDEASDFIREIKIDAEASFLDLHNVILDSVAYAKDQMTSFFVCDDDWGKKIEITLVDMGSSSEEDNYIMEDTLLEELLEDEGQKLLYVFDYLTERAFFMELREIIPGKNLDKPLISRTGGLPPPQVVDFEEANQKNALTDLFNEDFYGDSEYDMDELDKDGFEGLDEVNGNAFEEDTF
ncbi:MAG: hypothetical protein LBQ78_01505 [Tannerellaceae bacterium]|jgi:hypothetical protein|nr:hypothetical protein [Tannerellaceae bacterium]